MATPPTFSAGAVLTAAQMNQLGLFLVMSVPVGASSVSAVDISDAFSSDYDNYLISYSDIDASVNGAGFFLRFGTVASPVTTNYKFGGLFSGYTGTNLNLNQNTPGYWEVGGTSSDKASGQFYVNAPYLATPSFFTAQFARSDAAFVISGIQTDLTQHTDFHFYPSSGTMVGGTIRVFGIRK
jgi:hypothetical protein